MKKLLSAALALSLLTGGATFAYAETAASKAEAVKTRAVALDGVVVGVKDDGFRLDYGSQYINVDISNLVNSSIKSELDEGDIVRVEGVISDPWDAKKQVIAENVTITKQQVEEVDAIDPQTGEKVPGALITKEKITFEAAPKPGETIKKPLLVSGEVKQINGRNLLVVGADGSHAVDTMPLYVDPTGEYVFPKIEKGDTVQIQSLVEEGTDAIEAQKLVSIKKPYEEAAYEGQVLTAEGVQFVMATQTAAAAEAAEAASQKPAAQ